MTARLRRLGVAGLLTALLTLSAPGLAAAHSVLVSTDPAKDTRLTEAPERVSATFNERLQTAFAAMTVVGPDHNLWSTGDPQVDGPTVAVALRPLGPAGTYTVNYRVTSADGHVVAGSWRFELTVAGPGEPGPAVDAGGPAELPWWPFALGAVLIVAAGAGWSMRRRT